MDVCVRVGRRVEREEQSCEAAKASYKYKCPRHQTPTKRPPPRERRAGCTLSFPTCRHVNPHISVPPFRVYYSPLSLSLSIFFKKKKNRKLLLMCSYNCLVFCPHGTQSMRVSHSILWLTKFLRISY